MLPKRAFSKVQQALKKMRADWLEDRRENPNQVPYEIDSQLKRVIAGALREERVTGSRDYIDDLTADCFDYLVSKGQLIQSPYGGHMFPLPEDHAPLPSAKEHRQQVLKQMANQGFFGRKN